MIDMTPLNHTQRMESLVGLALAEHVDEENRRREEKELARQKHFLDVNDAARWAAEQIFSTKAAQLLLDWDVTAPGQSPEGMAEAVMVIPTEPYSVLLVFQAPLGTSEQMATNGSFSVIRPCSECGTDHADQVHSLADLGGLLTRHRQGELLQPHAAVADTPAGD